MHDPHKGNEQEFSTRAASCNVNPHSERGSADKQAKGPLWWPGLKHFIKHGPDELGDQMNSWNSRTIWKGE